MRGDERRLEHAGISLDIVETCGSNQYPSDDPEDSPSNKYRCLSCGAKWSVRVYGQFYNDRGVGHDAEAQAVFHYDRCPGRVGKR